MKKWEPIFESDEHFNCTPGCDDCRKHGQLVGCEDGEGNWMFCENCPHAHGNEDWNECPSDAGLNEFQQRDKALAAYLAEHPDSEEQSGRCIECGSGVLLSESGARFCDCIRGYWQTRADGDDPVMLNSISGKFRIGEIGWTDGSFLYRDWRENRRPLRRVMVAWEGTHNDVYFRYATVSVNE